MNKKQRIDALKSAVLTNDWEKAKRASNRLFHFGGRFNKTGRRKNRQFLLDLLAHENPQARNVVALTFRKNRFQSALEPLFQAINHAGNSRYRSTLTYALENLNCSQKLGELFAILFGALDNWSVQSSVLSILENQIFEFDRSDLTTINEQWEAIKPNWNKLNNIDENNLRVIDHDRNLVQSLVDGYLAYLK